MVPRLSLADEPQFARETVQMDVPKPVAKGRERAEPANSVAERILAECPIATTPEGLPYQYLRNRWKQVSDGELSSLALAFDDVTATSRSRRAEIVSYIKAKTLARDIKWRNIEPYEIPFVSGVLNLKTDELRVHQKEDWLEQVIPHDYDPEASCQEWRRALTLYFGRDPDFDEKCEALQEFFGYCLMAHARYKKALLGQGKPDSGKSVIAFIVHLMLGHENCSAVGVAEMDDARKRSPLVGKLANILTELTQDAVVQTADSRLWCPPRSQFSWIRNIRLRSCTSPSLNTSFLRTSCPESTIDRGQHSIDSCLSNLIMSFR